MNKQEFDELLAKCRMRRGGARLLDKWLATVSGAVCVHYKIRIEDVLPCGSRSATTDIFVTLPDGHTYGYMDIEFKREPVVPCGKREAGVEV